jgi:hypothetical protein
LLKSKINVTLRGGDESEAKLKQAVWIIAKIYVAGDMGSTCDTAFVSSTAFGLGFCKYLN